MFKDLLSKGTKKQFHISLIALVLTVIAVIAMVVVKNNVSPKIITADMIHSKEYETVESEDEGFDNCEFVKFTAFFTKDLDGNGTAEKLLGSCTNLNSTDTLYMDINVLSQGYLKDGKISIQGNNFDLNMAMIKDNVLKYNYISRSVKNIELNQINPGTQKLIIGNINPKIQNNINNYSSDSKVVFTGTYVDDEGHETPLRKEIDLKVEWYGDLYTTINGKNYASVYNFYTSEMESNTVEFEVMVSENTREMLMKENSLTLTIPALKGYDAIDAKCLNENVESNYDEHTHKLTLIRKAEPNSEGIIENKIEYINNYKIQINYPQDALDVIDNYEEINVPVEGYYVGYNLDAEGFENPLKSNVAEKTFSLVFEKEPSGEVFNFRTNIEDKRYVNEPFTGYAFSKQSLIDLLNGNGIENFEYIVSWKAIRGISGTVTNVTMKEKQDSESYGDKYDGTSFADYVSNKSMFFTSDLSFMNENGSVSIYNNDTNELIKTFTYDEIKRYNSTSSAYTFDEPVKHIRAEVVGGNAETVFTIYFVKTVDLEKFKTDFTVEQVESMDQFTTYIHGDCYEDEELIGGTDNIDSVKLIALRSNLRLNMYDENFSTQENYEHKTLTISARDFQYGDALWKNGQFLIKMPEEIIAAKINSVTSNNDQVTVIGYDLYQENNNYYLRVLTESEEAESFDISIDYNFNIDPRVSDCNRSYVLYGSNDNCDRYIHETNDVYDVNKDNETSDNVAVSTKNVRFVSPTSLITLETISNYNEANDVTVAPNVAEFDKETNEATVSLGITNNYNNIVKDITIMGKVPKANNSYVITKRDLGSNFDTYMTDAGINIPDEIKNITTVYYSTKDNCSYDYTDISSEWKLKDQVTDFRQVKSYLIILNNYELRKGVSHNFTYDITIEDALNYNDVAFSTHAVKYELATDNGTLAIETEPNRVGIRIVRKYNLNITKYRAGTNFVAPGNTYSINELNSNNEIVNTKLGTTDVNGNFVIRGIYIDTIYTLQEIRSSKDYELNNDLIIFKVVEDVNDKTKLQLQVLSDAQFRTTPVLSSNENGVDVFTTTVEDEPKYTLTITKNDEDGVLPGVWFYVKDKTGMMITDSEGKVTFEGLSANEDYTLVEKKADGHYLLGDINFKVVKNGTGNYSFETTNSEISDIAITNTADKNQVQVSIKVSNQKVPTYKLKVLKIEDSTDENKKYLNGAKFELRSADTGTKSYYTTNENGEIIIDDLYAFVDGKDISGLYTLQEVKAPTGYSNNAERIEFKVVKNQDNYSIEIVNESTLNTVYQKSVEGNVATITISDKPMFKLVKTDKDTGERLANVNFVIYELDASGNVKDYAKDVNNEYIGKLVDEQYVVTTDENGEVSLPLKDGKYQMLELDYFGYKKNITLYNFTVGEDTTEAVDPYDSYFTLADDIPEATGGIIEINYIEDLVDMAIATNKSYNASAGEESPYINKHIKLMRTLDFNQDSSYRNPNDQTTYGDYNKNNEVQTIKEELTTGKGWLPIANYSSEVFVSNTFDGQGFEIRNLYYDGNYQSLYNAAFISKPKDCVFKNLGITGNLTKVEGGIVAYPYGYIYVIDCYNKANISGTGYVGGIIGDTWGTNSVYIDNCYNTGTITGLQVGGITGYQGSHPVEVRNCHNDGEIIGSYAGGIHSMDRTTIMVNCYNTGKITGSSQAGGIAGRKEMSGKVIGCYNTGNVTASEAYGIAYCTGSNDFEKCYNTGNIMGTSKAAGMVYSAGKISECFNTGDVIATQWAAGIANSNVQNISDTYNDGRIETVGYINYTGNIAGEVEGICNGPTVSMSNVINAGKVIGPNGIEKYNLSARYYINNIENSYYIDTTKVSDEGIEISEEYSKTEEFYNRLNTNGVWTYDSKAHPKLKINQAAANITDGTQINVKNERLEYKITTDVNEIGRPKGGSISGENSVCYDSVKRGESNNKEIVMTPGEGYEIVSVTINGNKIEFVTDENGVFTINPGEISNIRENKHVVVTYGLKNQLYTIQKVDEDDESIKLQGAEFKIEQIEDYSSQVIPDNYESTSSDVNDPVVSNDTIVEGALEDIVSENEVGGFVKNGNKYVANFGQDTSEAKGTLNVDLTGLTGYYCVRFNITKDGTSDLYLKSSNSYSNFASVYNAVNEKDYFSAKLEGGKQYTITVRGISSSEDSVITINNVDLIKLEQCTFELVDGRYQNNNEVNYTRADGEIKIDLSKRPGKYRITINDIYHQSTRYNNATIYISGENEGRIKIPIEKCVETDYETIVNGGKIYTIEVYYTYYSEDPGYLRFAPPIVENVLTTYTETTDEQGLININTLPGRYKIRETKAPDGYELNSQEFEVEVTANSEKSIKITNKKKTPTVNITTDVEEYEKENQFGETQTIRGGTITGEDETPYEEVEIGGNNAKNIVVTPDESYKISKLLINDKSVAVHTNANGIAVIPVNYFMNMQEDKEVVVRFEKQDNLSSTVTTHYVLDGTGPAYNTTPIEIIDPITTTGTIGDEYITELKIDIDDYELIKDNNGEYVVPENASGTYTESDIDVYYYYRLKPVVLTVHHYLDGTTTKVAEDVVDNNYYKGDHYITKVSYDALEKYDLAYIVGDAEGQINEDKEVIYYYNKKDAKVIVHYVENGTETKLAEDITINGKVDDSYTTSSSDDVPANYTLVSKTDNWNGTMTVADIEVTYYYQRNTFTVTPQINKKCNLSKLTDRTTQVPYVITYNAVIKDYMGDVEVEITDTLEYKIDVANSNLNGGIYDDSTKTIKWKLIVPNINTYNDENNEHIININKTISLLYKDVDELADSIRNNVKGVLRIENTTRENEAEAKTEISLPGHLVVRYVDKYTDEEIADRILKDGELGTSFNTDDYKKTIANYTLVEEPDPKTGVYTKGTITKTFYYAMNASLRVQHIDKLTNQKLVDDEVTNGKENDDYTTASKIIEHYKVSQADLPTNANGKLTVVRNSNGTYTTETVVKYYYIHDAKVIENHIDIIDNRVLATETHNGYEGDSYNIPSRTIDGYTLVETYNNENKIPENKAGNMTRSDITVNYYYIRPAKVIVQHIDKATNEKIADDETINGVQNQAYATSSKNVENYVLVETPDNKNGSMTVTVDGDGTVHDTTTVTYIYSHVSAGVIEKHVDIETGEILYNEVHDGNEGDAYKIDPKEYDENDGTTINFKGYELVETDRDSVNRLPANAEGTMTIEPITVTYYYRRPAKVRVQYIDKLTGETLTDDVLIEGYQNDSYTTASKTFENYKLDESDLPTNAEGQMVVSVDDQGKVEDETIVKYYYIHDAKVVEKHIDIMNNEVIYTEDHEGYEGDQYDIDAKEYNKENNLNKEFEGYDLVTELDGENKLPANSEGSMTRETIEVIYYYIKQTAVKANYYDIYTNEKIANEEIINGHEGDQYETEDKDIDGYEIVLKDRDGNIKYPTNTIGEMTKDIIEVNYYYIKQTSVTARYYDIVSGEEIADQIKKDGLEGDEYTTTEKTIDNYDIVETNYPTNTEGKMTAEPIFVDYYYIRRMKVIVHYVDRDTKEEVAEDIIMDGHEGDVYHTKALDVEGYELVRVPKDKDGTMSYVTVNGEKRDYKEVTYYYAFIIDKPVFPQTGENSDKFIVIALIGLGFVLMATSKKLYNKNQKRIEQYNKQMKEQNSNKDI